MTETSSVESHPIAALSAATSHLLRLVARPEPANRTELALIAAQLSTAMTSIVYASAAPEARQEALSDESRLVPLCADDGEPDDLPELPSGYEAIDGVAAGREVAVWLIEDPQVSDGAHLTCSSAHAARARAAGKLVTAFVRRACDGAESSRAGA